MELGKQKSIFKVGDTVTIKKREGDSWDYKFSFTDSMAEHAGERFKVSKVISGYYDKSKRPDDGHLYELEGTGFNWASSMFEDPDDVIIDSLSMDSRVLDSNTSAFIKKKKCPELDFSL